MYIKTHISLFFIFLSLLSVCGGCTVPLFFCFLKTFFTSHFFFPLFLSFLFFCFSTIIIQFIKMLYSQCFFSYTRLLSSLAFQKPKAGSLQHALRFSQTIDLSCSALFAMLKVNRHVIALGFH